MDVQQRFGGHPDVHGRTDDRLVPAADACFAEAQVTELRR